MIYIVLFFFVNFNIVSGLESSTMHRYVDINCLFGLPEKQERDFYIFRRQYIVNYNDKLNITNFVMYRLTAEDYGLVSRYNGNFLYDTLISKLNLQKITHKSYSNSGYDRGHLVRSEERTKTKEDNKSTFYLTNIVPQTPDLNSGVWYKLERHCEDLVKKNRELYITSGTIFSKNKKYHKNILIPDTLFKIIIINNNTTPKRIFLKRIDVICVKIPNINGIRKHNWEDYVCTIRDIERSIGYNFNATTSKSFQDILENIKYKKI